MANMENSGTTGQSPLTTFNEYRSLLFSIAYRMVGSVADAEDMVQEAFIRWQQAATTKFDPRRHSWSPSSAASPLTICNPLGRSASSTWANGCLSQWDLLT